MSTNPDLSTEDLARGANRDDPAEGPAVGAGRYAESESTAARDSAVDPGSAVPGETVQRPDFTDARGVQQGRVEITDAEEATPGALRGSDTGQDTGTVSLLESSDADRFRARWSDVQTRFVDDPREAVSTADGLVAELMQTLAANFAEHKSRLETQWSSGSDDTEELRQALQRYRSFFDRLLQTS